MVELPIEQALVHSLIATLFITKLVIVIIIAANYAKNNVLLIAEKKFAYKNVLAIYQSCMGVFLSAQAACNNECTGVQNPHRYMCIELHTLYITPEQGIYWYY